MKYTVLLLYPRSMCDGETQTFCAHVSARDEHHAVKSAQRQAFMANHGTIPAADFELLYLFSGHQEPY